jgi:predicted RNase H-like nuclease
MTFVGVDGCKAGWLSIEIKDISIAQWNVFTTLNELHQHFSENKEIYIDIPIGLSDTLVDREIDYVARTKLKPNKSSSIFTPPCRDAVYATDYISAKLINLKQKGKSISIQSWNICQKIKETDLLIEQIGAHHPFREAHPELCFAQLNNGKALFSKKSTLVGIKERLDLLQKYYPSSIDLFEKILENSFRKNVKPDDITDAICLAVSAYIAGKNELNKIIGKHLYDSKGILMALYYPNLPAHS